MTFISLEKSNRVAIVRIDREKKLNALNSALIEELAQTFDAIRKDDTVRAVILTGSGSKAFVAGADIGGFPDLSAAEGQALAKQGQVQLFDKIANFPKPVVAAVNGYALGGGLELALACHIRIASVNTQMGLPEVSLGLIPGYGGTQRLPQVVGRGRALELILTARMIDAEKAFHWGLVNAVVPLENLMEQAQKYCQQILKNAPSALGAALAAVNHPEAGKAAGFAFEIEQFGACFGTSDFDEGVSAFLEKRKPNF